MIHLTKSKEAQKFLDEAGLEIKQDSCHNYITLVDVKLEDVEVY